MLGQVGRKVTFGRRDSIGMKNQFGFEDEFGSNDQLGMKNEFGVYVRNERIYARAWHLLQRKIQIPNPKPYLTLNPKP